MFHIKIPPSVDNGLYSEAISTLETMFDLFAAVFKNDKIKPPIHYREHDDLYALVAYAYLKDNNKEKAYYYLEKMVKYDTEEYPKINNSTGTESPLLLAKSHEFYIKRFDRFESAYSKLTSKRFEDLFDEERFKRLLLCVS